MPIRTYAVLAALLLGMSLTGCKKEEVVEEPPVAKTDDSPAVKPVEAAEGKIAAATPVAQEPPPKPPADGSCSSPLYGSFNLRFSAGPVVHEAFLLMTGCSGSMLVKFFSSSSQKTEQVLEKMRIKPSARGTLISGFDPVYAESGSPDPTYAADNFLLQQATDGSWSFTNQDDAGRGSPVELVSFQLPPKLSFQSQCDKTISVAMLYKSLEGQWVRRGWWTLKHGEKVDTGISTMNTKAYFFAEAEGLEWSGNNVEGSVSRSVVSAAFTETDDRELSGPGLKTVKFFPKSVDLTEAVHTESFRCDHKD